MKIKYILPTLLTTLFLTACGDSTESADESVEQEVDTTSVDLNDAELEESALGADLNTCINIHNQVYPVDVPFKANYVFGEYEGYFPLKDNEKVSFSLDKAGLDLGAETYLEGFMELSADFLSYIFVTYPSQNEMSTYIVTYEPDYTFVDALEIGYDEIAEGFVFKESEVSANGIQMKKFTYFEEENVEMFSYEIAEDGKISEVKPT
jgi:hypothetical protein